MFQVSNKHSDNQIKTDHTHQYGIVNHTDSPKKKTSILFYKKYMALYVCKSISFKTTICYVVCYTVI